MTSTAARAGHVALLGDSIFDNAAYVRGGPDVVAQLRGVLPSGWHASLLAVDGAVVRRGYGSLLDAIGARGLPPVACTIYEDSFPDSAMQRLAATALTVFNDAIVRAAVTRGIGLIDLRLVCTATEHYANPIEPSVRGGERISAAIVEAVFGGRGRRTVVTAGSG